MNGAKHGKDVKKSKKKTKKTPKGLKQTHYLVPINKAHALLYNLLLIAGNGVGGQFHMSNIKIKKIIYR